MRDREAGARLPRPALRSETVQTREAVFWIETVVEGLEILWEIAFVEGGREMLIAERGRADRQTGAPRALGPQPG